MIRTIVVAMLAVGCSEGHQFGSGSLTPGMADPGPMPIPTTGPTLGTTPSAGDDGTVQRDPIQTPPQTPTPPPECAAGVVTALVVPSCLEAVGMITHDARVEAELIFDGAHTLLPTLTGQSYSDMSQALQRIRSYYVEGWFTCPERFTHMVDHVAVTVDWVQGKVPSVTGGDGRVWHFPTRTPYVAWNYYTGLVGGGTGIFMQPVEAIEAFLNEGGLIGNVPLDQMINTAVATRKMATPTKLGDGVVYPVWEYNFPWNSEGVIRWEGWYSGFAQGTVLQLYVELFKRTGEPIYMTLAMEIFRGMMVPWSKGGSVLDGLTGNWWEEFSPQARIWNGAMLSLVAIGDLASVTDDATVKQAYRDGILAAKTYTPLYDTGNWTLYSLYPGKHYNNRWYMGVHVRLAQALYNQSLDPYFQDLAKRWAVYAANPPPGY